MAAPSTSSWLNTRPEVVGQSRASKYSGVTPTIMVDQLRLPHTSWPEPRMVGAATTTPCTSRWIVHASSSVRLIELPAPARKPPDVVEPGKTKIMLAPSAWSCSATRA